MKIFLFVGCAIFLCSIPCYLCSKVGDTCQNNSQCDSYGQYCKVYTGCSGNGVCTCQDGLIINSDFKTCAKQAKIGESCNSNTVCPSTNAECDSASSTCKCTSNNKALPDNSYCVASTSKLLGQSCTIDSECNAISQARCNAQSSGSTAKTCQCASGTYADSTNSHCMWYTYGASCGGSTACNPGMYQCTNNVCACLAGRKWYSPSSYCVNSAATITVLEGGACNEDLTGSSGKFCTSGLTCASCPVSETKTCLRQVPNPEQNSNNSGFTYFASSLRLTICAVILAKINW